MSQLLLITIESQWGHVSAPATKVQEDAYARYKRPVYWDGGEMLLEWRHCGVDLVVILHNKIDIGGKFHQARKKG